jgi:hypothetical protein
MDWISFFSMQGVAALSALFIFVIGCGALLAIILFIIDLSQTRDAIRHNFPVIGRFRTLFSRLGEFFRQYFFAMDREEMPFNRAEREWVYHSAVGSHSMGVCIDIPTAPTSSSTNSVTAQAQRKVTLSPHLPLCEFITISLAYPQKIELLL